MAAHAVPDPQKLSLKTILNGKTLLWNTPEGLWDGWTEDHFEVFDVVVPKPGACFSSVVRVFRSVVRVLIGVVIEILLLGTGKTMVLPPPSIRQYLSKIGIQIDVMNTVRSQYSRCDTA